MAQEPSTGRRALCAERVFDGRKWLDFAAVLIERGRILGLSGWGDLPGEVARHDAPKGAILAPGLIDLQVNGGGGVLLNDRPTPEGMLAIARAHRRLGTTALLPTLITDAREKMDAAIAAARSVAGADGVLGLHLEGPYLSPAHPGVHRKDRLLRAQMRDVEGLRDLPARSLVTLAPECVPDGFVRELAAAGIRVSAGHSEATADRVLQAIDEGLTGVTHLFNAMPPLMGRAPGIVGAALAEPRLTAGLIVDGFHVDPVSVRAAFAAKGASAIALVSDAMPTVGGALREFDLMERRIVLSDGKLTTEEGTLAGAHLDMACAVRNAVTMAGIPLADALRAATFTPAAFLGVEQERGAFVPGARGDVLCLLPDLTVHSVWVGGELIG